MKNGRVPIIDVFAGPGGLGEGFSALRDKNGDRLFQIALSVEKDSVACRTLRLRSIRRSLEESGRLDTYFSLLRGELARAEFEVFPIVREAIKEAEHEVLNAELGKNDAQDLDRRIAAAVKGSPSWVLIGGPPCQAYSLAGRARRANDAAFEEDEKHFLYKEYLRIIREHAPPVFVMENVKGLLSSHHGGSPMFSRILGDLAEPMRGVSYEIRSLVRRPGFAELAPNDYIIESEHFGVPQTRHRLILVGVRSDVAHQEWQLLDKVITPATVGSVLAGMPEIRSRLSRGRDDLHAWHESLRATIDLVRGTGMPGEHRLLSAMRTAIARAKDVEGTGSAFTPMRATRTHSEVAKWISAPGLDGVVQHEARDHMPSDLGRYMFAASYAQEFGSSPRLAQFPNSLLPAHQNAKEVNGVIPFRDRFRVQCENTPSATIVSHIAKDGHYYIHYDPAQCRSLTVREAARLQTFPDDYFFEGTRTQQYVQVGNAVPPFLARQIAEIVHGLVAPALQQPAHARKAA
ncbi:DNA cytosine methyltransferase [Acidovorax sp.]|uniref:DNA cytosine methyltransferase n=1 Tax=Acidovorax sp. TaxID=1872122 RepID=UPI002ACDED84|nr:DNA cytosine methyltransferase [Acidovorax sp.]MDZ7867243.1 DNA cytosine methyltransferase [Acidovorax sp.]